MQMKSSMQGAAAISAFPSTSHSCPTHLVELPQILFLCLVDDSKNSGDGLAHNATKDTQK